MKATATTTVKITVKGVELDLTADEARDLSDAIIKAIGPKKLPIDWPRKLYEEESKRSFPMGLPYPRHSFESPEDYYRVTCMLASYSIL